VPEWLIFGWQATCEIGEVRVRMLETPSAIFHLVLRRVHTSSDIGGFDRRQGRDEYPCRPRN
ncbi:hypothetical protein, partial [Paraburkholderia tropica]|uniref:hypothetical protein n=1 Tax=Paraburkholderia tropica TaxID=92647 RepID=UPI002AAF8018